MNNHFESRYSGETEWKRTTEAEARKCLGSSNGIGYWTIAEGDMRRGLTVSYCGLIEFRMNENKE